MLYLYKTDFKKSEKERNVIYLYKEYDCLNVNVKLLLKLSL